MRKLAVVVSLLAAVGLMALVAAAFADRGHGHHGGNGGMTFSARLIGFQETPSQSTPGRGTFKARIVNGDTIHYKLHYQGFESTEGSTLFSHIHFGQAGVAGGVAAYLCGGGNKPASRRPRARSRATSSRATSSARQARGSILARWTS